MAETATVELLTAEVRVLMVGSRQVTLSVAKQLDRLGLSAIEPFGRIRLGDGKQQVIGRARKDGALAVAEFERFPVRSPWISMTDLDPSMESLPVICDSLQPYTSDPIRVLFNKRTVSFERDAMARCGKHPFTAASGSESCGGWRTMGHDKHIQAAIDAWDAQCAQHDRAAALPLIVLAGLK